jgi:choline kinase
MDDVKSLAEEEMKIVLGPTGTMQRINKAIDPAEAAGEYIGVTRIAPGAADGLADALEATWRRDTTLYYEDGYQEYADRGGEVAVAPIGRQSWVEVDNHEDLARAREIACHY